MAYFGLKEEEANRAIFRSGEGIVGKVYKNGIPMVLRDLNERVYLNLMGLRERLERGTSFLAVPIKNRGEVIGVLAIFRNLSPEDFIERAIELLQEVAVLISMAYQMERKLTYERITWDEERRILTEALEERVELSSIIGQSKIMRDIMYLVKRISLSAANVLITGESGTGKTLFAKIIHHLSSRWQKPFVIVNLFCYS
ncbi:MAG: sigma 54-interacting transcriptional regulator [Caldimicrobium sp.]|nr:sigma 54-interacting transcriptional regulator [Caldimicrobium sp.]MCX7873372.1 sigma 54-interacting transcriptional regulator [Caldimicrobium sp.]MDW8093798.1 sigma 54-interacting transcriptional regulator [Caldimicrobium sp.]